MTGRVGRGTLSSPACTGLATKAPASDARPPVCGGLKSSHLRQSLCLLGRLSRELRFEVYHGQIFTSVREAKG